MVIAALFVCLTSCWLAFGTMEIHSPITCFAFFEIGSWGKRAVLRTCAPTNHRRGTQEDNKAMQRRRTDQWLVSLFPAVPGRPIAVQSAKPLAFHCTERPSRCAHGSGRGDHATPSRPRQRACAGGAACVTAVSASGTDGSQLRQHRALLKCPVRRGGGACSGLSARQGPRNSWGYSVTVCERQCPHRVCFCRSCGHFFGGMRGACSALKMGLFLHAVGSVTPTESAEVRLKQSTTRLALTGLLAGASYPARRANCSAKHKLTYSNN